MIIIIQIYFEFILFLNTRKLKTTYQKQLIGLAIKQNEGLEI